MKIWGDSFSISKIYDKQKNLGRVENTKAIASKKDVVSISTNAKDFTTVSKALREVPEIRQEKVNELSTLYNSGSYDVTGQQIVEKLGKALIDKKA